ncbi:11260_t:CDS:2 [Entrophospora sp. SA101]|nr:11260_t:CDS:2 [Entrophospora sp. SA101]
MVDSPQLAELKNQLNHYKDLDQQKTAEQNNSLTNYLTTRNEELTQQITPLQEQIRQLTSKIKLLEQQKATYQTKYNSSIEFIKEIRTEQKQLQTEITLLQELLAVENIQNVALRKLEQLDQAKNLLELTIPLHNRLEALRVIMTRKLTIYHPGKILKEEFLIPAQISSTQLARDINISNKVIQEIVTEKRDLTKDIATRLALYFGTAPTF